MQKIALNSMPGPLGQELRLRGVWTPLEKGVLLCPGLSQCYYRHHLNPNLDDHDRSYTLSIQQIFRKRVENVRLKS